MTSELHSTIFFKVTSSVLVVESLPNMESKIVSIQASRIKEVNWQNRLIKTGIFKEKVKGPVLIKKLSIDGDEQADPKYHGGEYMAVYSYAVEHYEFWKKELSRSDLTYGMFGENVTTTDFDERATCIGDRVRFGTALLEAVQPRYPCFKLGIRFGDQQIIQQFIEAERSGIYWRVLEEGLVDDGSAVEIEYRHPKKIKVSEIFDVMIGKNDSLPQLKKLFYADVIDPRWKAKLEKKMSSTFA
jgi:MOSC domain-containing protein YiiM